MSRPQELLRQQMVMVLDYHRYSLPKSVVDTYQRIQVNTVTLKFVYVVICVFVNLALSIVFFPKLLVIFVIGLCLALGIFVHFEEHTQTRKSFWPSLLTFILIASLIMFYEFDYTLNLIVSISVTICSVHAAVFTPPSAAVPVQDFGGQEQQEEGGGEEEKNPV